MVSGQNELIYVGIPRERFYLPAFVDNRDNILARLHQAGRDCGYYQAESHRVDRNRDRIVQKFLAHEQKPAWLLMLDSDMEHPADCGLRLAEWNKPVVGGLYFHRGQSHDPIAFRASEPQLDEYGRMVPMWEPLRDEVYRWLTSHRIPMKDGAFTVGQAGQAGILPVDAVGTGCLLIHRSVLEAMKPPWFEYRDGSQSEDLEFCQRVRDEQGVPVYVDMSTVSGHYSMVAMGQTQFRMIYEGRGVSLSGYTARQAQAWLDSYLPPESTQPLTEYRNQTLIDLWQAANPTTPAETEAFYENVDTGLAYLYDLLYWNASPDFKRIQQHLVKVRGQRVLEIGGGIGTVAIQLAFQGNSVDSVEPNRVLRRFARKRWEEAQAKAVGQFGLAEFATRVKTGLPEAIQQYDLVVAIDVFEHIHPESLPAMLVGLSQMLKVGGRMFFHNNFGQQDIYPMHFDHSAEWAKWLGVAGLFQLDDVWAVRVR